MSPVAKFFDRVLREGRALFSTPLFLTASLPNDILPALERAYADYALQLAGPPLEFDGPVALAAAGVLSNACWFLLSSDEPDSALEKMLLLPGPPSTPAAHFSADLMLRYLPQVHRRAKARNPADRLTTLLADVLRRWPLSGILADIDEKPLAAIDFDGHVGLCLLYAERLARNEKPAWVPHGLAQAYVELVYGELGKDPSALLLAAQGGAGVEAAHQQEDNDD
jgi:hypothetical protein